ASRWDPSPPPPVPFAPLVPFALSAPVTPAVLSAPAAPALLSNPAAPTLLSNPAAPGGSGVISRGTRPARSRDDLPEPDAPTSISGRPSAPAAVAIAASRSVSAVRPKNHRASAGWKLARPW